MRRKVINLSMKTIVGLKRIGSNKKTEKMKKYYSIKA